MKRIITIIDVSMVLFTGNMYVFGQDSKMCPCIWYDSDRCECTEKSECICGNCTKDEKCKCIIELKKITGTITGIVKNPIIRMKEAAVYIEKIEGKKFEVPRKNPVIDQVNLVFVPHILPVLVGSIVDFPNSDTVRHNVFSTPKSVNQFNLGTYDVGIIKHVTFEKEGLVSLLCNVHAEMSAYVIVLQNPYFAVTDKQGKFIIRNVPQGKHILTFWHESLKSEAIDIDVSEQKTADVEFKDLKRK